MVDILSENEHELQQVLNGVYNYCIKIVYVLTQINTNCNIL